MKDPQIIRADDRVITSDKYEDGFSGYVSLKGLNAKRRDARFVCSWGGGWDHVSVSFRDRCPVWKEMCEVKDIFFGEDEVCVQYHPKKEEYINNHPYCLHIFRPQNEKLPTPPSWMVGLKDWNRA